MIPDDVSAMAVLTKLNREVSSRPTSKQEGVRRQSALGLLHKHDAGQRGRLGTDLVAGSGLTSVSQKYPLKHEVERRCMLFVDLNCILFINFLVVLFYVTLRAHELPILQRTKRHSNSTKKQVCPRKTKMYDNSDPTSLRAREYLITLRTKLRSDLGTCKRIPQYTED